MTQFTKLDVAIPTKTQVDKGLTIIRDQLSLDKKRDDLKENKKSLHDVFTTFFDGVPNWVNEIWNSPGNNPMSNTHFDVNMFARAYCGMLASPQYTEILEFTHGLAESKDKATFTIWFTDKKKGKLVKLEQTKEKRKWAQWLGTQFTNRVHLICDKERDKKTPTLTSEFNAAAKRMLKALENDKFKGQKSAKHRSEMKRQIIGFQDYGINVTLK
tara:strand:- start:243 stop:884 length:642 start_codon:yes stop_codon:yes gene_type:complete